MEAVAKVEEESYLDKGRVHPRIPFFETVYLKRPDKAEVACNSSVDLSTLGIALNTDSPLWPGQRCGIEFDVGCAGNVARKIIVNCEAWHCGYSEDLRGYRVGLMFLDLTFEDTCLIDALVQQGE